MKIFHIDPTVATHESASEFGAIFGPDTMKKLDGDEDEIINELGKLTSGVAIFLVHRSPSAAAIRELCRAISVRVIYIGLSKDAPSLAVASGFEDQVASFSWPFSSGAGLARLGMYINERMLANASTPESDLVLGAMQEYFSTDFDDRALIAAYLLRKIHADDASFQSSLSSVGLAPEYSRMSQEKLRATLESRASRFSLQAGPK